MRGFTSAVARSFPGGYSTGCFAAYHHEFPLADGWELRVHLHQLAPLAVHAIKFGGGDAAAVDDALDRLGL